MRPGRDAMPGTVGRLAGLSIIALACVPATAAATGAATARCATSGLVVWLDTRGDAAAGSVYYHLDFTNESGRTCSLAGYPGVSAVDLGGRRLGSPARRNPSTARTITLREGASAAAVLRVGAGGNFPESMCHRVRAAGIRVYPPDAVTSKVVPFPFDACARTGPVFLSVDAVVQRGS
jgi:hypothetical protein